MLIMSFEVKQVMVDSSPTSRIVGAESPVVGLSESRDSYFWTRRIRVQQ